MHHTNQRFHLPGPSSPDNSQVQNTGNGKMLSAPLRPAWAKFSSHWHQLGSTGPLQTVLPKHCLLDNRSTFWDSFKGTSQS